MTNKKNARAWNSAGWLNCYKRFYSSHLFEYVLNYNTRQTVLSSLLVKNGLLKRNTGQNWRVSLKGIATQWMQSFFWHRWLKALVSTTRIGNSLYQRKSNTLIKFFFLFFDKAMLNPKFISFCDDIAVCCYSQTGLCLRLHILENKRLACLWLTGSLIMHDRFCYKLLKFFQFMFFQHQMATSLWHSTENG